MTWSLPTGGMLFSDWQASNPRLRSRDLEALFARHLGGANVCWLDGGLIGDDTDGHVDTIARFVAPGRIVAVEPGGRDRDQLERNLKALRAWRLLDGSHADVVCVPYADLRIDGRQVAASYANFYFTNRSLIVPVYGLRPMRMPCEFWRRHVRNAKLSRWTQPCWRYKVVPFTA